MSARLRLANERFFAPVKEGCKKCEVAYARCERNLRGLELDLYAGHAMRYHRVYAPGVRVAVLGPAAMAKVNCEFLAADMMKRGLSSAACFTPKPTHRSPALNGSSCLGRIVHSHGRGYDSGGDQAPL